MMPVSVAEPTEGATWLVSVPWSMDPSTRWAFEAEHRVEWLYQGSTCPLTWLHEQLPQLGRPQPLLLTGAVRCALESLSKEIAKASDQAALGARGADWKESFGEDVEYYRQNLEQMLQKYSGKYIAIVNKAVVDEDVDFSSLAKRVFRRYGYRDIFMPRVTQDEEVVSIPSPRIVRG